MNNEYIKARLLELEKYLDRNWKGLADNFVERIIARAEHEKLTKKLYE